MTGDTIAPSASPPVHVPPTDSGGLMSIEGPVASRPEMATKK